MSHSSDEFDLPPRLADAVRDAYTHRVAIPRRLDDALLATARAKFERRRRTRLMIRWGTGLAAGLAAAITLALVLHRPSHSPAQTLAKGDLNADGRVTMVDALVLARRIAAKDPVDPAWDTNADGRVDQQDVDALAAAAVNLKQSGLAHRSLPKLHELGLNRVPVGLASASGTPREPTQTAFAHPRGRKNQEAHP
jgi:hypothetical protein